MQLLETSKLVMWMVRYFHWILLVWRNSQIPPPDISTWRVHEDFNHCCCFLRSHVQVTLFSWQASGIFLAALFTTTLCSKNIISFKAKHFLKFPAEKHIFFPVALPIGFLATHLLKVTHIFSCRLEATQQASVFHASLFMAGILWGNFFMSFSDYTLVFDKSCANISSPAVTFKIEFTTVL